MMAFASLEDTPMFRKQLNSAENTAYELKDRCQKFYKGCKKFTTSIGESCNGDLSFAESLEAFGAGNDDPISVSIGGPVMSKFTTAFRELSTYKELLRSQVEHMLSDRLYEFITTDLQDVKDARRRFEKAQLSYDQGREKVMSLKKGTPADVVTALEEDLQNAKSTFERCRFNLVNALANIEAKKKYEFLESITAVMDAQMRYFKQGYQLLNQMEPFIHQILTYTQQLKEMTKTENDNLAKRIQEFRTQEQLDSLKSHSGTEASTNGDGIHTVGTSSYKSIEALMQSSVNGQVQTIKQGYLLKQSSNVRGGWKRRFFVLDSHGTLYYYRNNNRQSGSQLKHSISIPEQSIGVFSRFRFAHRRSLSQDEVNLSCHTVDLRTSTVKIDAELSDLRFCFRIISPLKSYTLQAENDTERADWVDKITAVITSLLTSPFPNQSGSQSVRGDRFSAADGSIPHLGNNHTYMGKNGRDEVQHDVCKVLKKVPGNDICAECGSSEPDWASLNLGVLLCIECSGIHRNLGVHISKIRSLTLDVRVWESSVLDLFCALGNSYCNSIWEELLYHKDDRIDEQNEFVASITKPAPRDSNSLKEKYIQLKYAEKHWVAKTTKSGDLCAALFWEAIETSNVQQAYRLLVVSDANPNMTYEMTNPCDLWHNTDVHRMNKNSQGTGKQCDPACCQKIKDTGEPAECRQGCAALHLACNKSDLVMLELLLQSGADINIQDYHGRTPLHHCVFMKNNLIAKYLIKRGANPSIKDSGGQTALERAMEFGPVTDEELLILLVGS